jgi:hypothetical protein
LKQFNMLMLARALQSFLQTMEITMVDAISATIARTNDQTARTPEQEVMSHFDAVLADLLAGCAAAEKQVAAIGAELQTQSSQQPPDIAPSNLANVSTPTTAETEIPTPDGAVNDNETPSTRATALKNNDNSEGFLSAINASKIYQTSAQMSSMSDALFKIIA